MTNAWIQRFLVIGSFGLWWWLATVLWTEHTILAWLCVAMPFLVIPLVLGLQFVLHAWVNGSDPAPQATLGERVRAWLGEWHAANMVFNRWQPFARKAIPDNLLATPGRRGVVLVHGYFCNRGFWTWWMRALQKQLRVFMAVDLEPAYGSISDYAALIEQAVSQVERATGLPPLLVGHSMGGLAIRAWLASNPAHAWRVHRCVSLGSPHHGTWFASWSHTQNGTQMRLDSDWLQALARQEQAAQSMTPTYNAWVCYYSNCDNIVFPVSSAMLAGADNRLEAGLGHVNLAFSPRVMQECLDLL
jgi:triacylglycerol lipase